MEAALRIATTQKGRINAIVILGITSVQMVIYVKVNSVQYCNIHYVILLAFMFVYKWILLFYEKGKTTTTAANKQK